MAVETNTIVTRAEVEDGTGPGAAAAVNSIEKIAGAQERLNERVRQSQSAFGYFDKAASSAATRLNQLRGAADPTFAAMQRLERAERDLDRAMKQGLTTEAEKLRILDQLSVKYGTTSAANQNLASAQATVAGSSARMGSAIQQAGFQVGDFAVQVASGQGVLRPFIQQATQLVSAFGPAGAVVGAFGAIVGAVAVSVFSADEATSDLDEAIVDLGKRARDTTADFADFRREVDDLTTAQRGLLGVNVAQQLIELQNVLPELDGQLDRVGRGFQRVLEFDASRISDFAEYTGAAEQDLRALAEAGARLSAVSTDEQIDALANAVAQFVSKNPGAIEKMGGDLSNLLTTLRSSATARDNIERLEKALDGLGQSAAGVRGATDEQTKFADRVKEAIAALSLEVHHEQLLNQELAAGKLALSDLSRVREGYTAVQRLGIDALSDEGQEIIGLIDKLEQEKAIREQLVRDDKGREFLDAMERENEMLRLRLVHGEDEVTILQKQADLRATLGRDLLPAEAASVRRLAEEHRRLTGDIESSAEAEKKLLKTLESADDMPDEVVEEFIAIIEEIAK